MATEPGSSVDVEAIKAIPHYLWDHWAVDGPKLLAEVERLQAQRIYELES